MVLESEIEDIRSAIKARSFGNEAAISQGIVLRLLSALGWPVYNTRSVIPEYPLNGRRVDFALCHPPSKPIAFVEVKMLGQSNGAERQLFEYAFHMGVPLVILTDGQEWNFFLPSEQGDYWERRVYKLDIVERDTGECTLRLNRYLRYDAVISGTAIEAAREDYRNVSRERQINTTLPRAWKQLLSDEDELLLELLADRVESLCGYKPDLDTVASFLKNHVSATSSTQAMNTLPLQPRSPTPNHVLLAPNTDAGTVEKLPSRLPTSTHVLPLATQLPRAVGFEFDGQHHSARSGIDVLEGIMEELIARDSSFPERFASLPKHGRTRRYLARTPDELYPGRPDLARNNSRQLSSGWWIGTNYNHGQIYQIIEIACNVAHLQYGKDLRVELGE